MSGEYRFTVGGDFSEILRAFDRLDQRAQQSGQNIGRGINEGVTESSLRSIAALEARLQRLRGQQARVEIGSTGFREVTAEIQRVENLLAAVNRQKLSLGVDPRSIVALRSQLDALNTQLGSVAIGSEGFRVLQRQIQGVERDLRRAGEAGGIAAKGVGLVRGAIGLLGGLSIGAAVTGFFRESIQQAIQLETATRRLTNTLGPQGAGQALGFVRGISDQLGLSFRVLVDSYGRFTAAATAANVPIGQQQELFTAVSRAGQALGLSTDEVNGAFLALQQIASKGTVSMEELRQQLGERLPIALAATAKGLGLSTKELIKLVETGQLSANRFFPAFTKGLNELTQGAQGMPTAAQNLQRFTNAWESLQVAFGQNLLPTITAGVNQLTLAIEELKTQSEGVRMGLSPSVGMLGNQEAGLLGNVQRLRKEYNLSDEAYKSIYDNAVRLSNVKRSPISDTLIIDAKAAEDISNNFEQLAINYRKQNKDKVAETNAQAAALTNLQTKLDESVKKQRESASIANQREGIAILEAEAALVSQVAAGKVTQAEADKTLAGQRRAALQAEISGYDTLIAKLEKAKASGSSEGTDKNILAAQSARAQKVLELAKLEADGSRAEVDRRKELLQLSITQLGVVSQRVELEDRAGQLALSRLRTQQQVADALSNLQQAQQGLTQSLFAVDTARQDFEIRSAEQVLQRLRDRGATVGEIRRQEEYIASLKRGAETIARRALEAEISSAAQRFELERRVLELKQAQQLIEAQSAQRAAQQNAIQQQQKLLELKQQLADPTITGAQRQVLTEQVALQRQAISLAQQQQRAESGRLQSLGLIFGLEQQTLNAQQQTAANGLRAQAATQGWENALSGPLSNLDAAARSTAAVGAGVQQISAGFITVGGQTVQIKATVEDLAGSTANAASAASALADGYAIANGNALALLSTLRNIAATPQARWAGGPVDPSTAYRINELGQESLLTPGGSLSLINAPANSMWRPPSRGTVLPAGLTARLRESGAFGRGVPAAGGGARLGNLEREIAGLRVEIRALRQKQWTNVVRTPSAAGLLRLSGGL